MDFSIWLITIYILFTPFILINKMLNIKWGGWIFISSLILAFIYSYLNIFSSIFLVSYLVITVFLLGENWKKSFYIGAFIMVSVVISEQIAGSILGIIFSTIEGNLIEYIIYAIISAVISYTFLFTIGRKAVKYIDDNDAEMIATVLGYSLLVGIYTNLIYGRFQGIGMAQEVLLMNTIFFIVYAILFATMFYMYNKMQNQKKLFEQEQRDRKNMETYTKEIENRFHEMRKFRHDYHNVLSSFDRFLKEENIDGLKTYYYDKIKPGFESLEMNEFQLEQLNQIKVLTLKSILFSKFMEAEKQGITTEIEVSEVIEKVETDPLIYVRAIGIIMDNAIEYLASEKTGELRIASFTQNGKTCVIIANTVTSEIPTIAEMKRPDFSTKGENRGQGLPTIGELMAKAESFSVETSVEDNLFIQKIWL